VPYVLGLPSVRPWAAFPLLGVATVCLWWAVPSLRSAMLLEDLPLGPLLVCSRSSGGASTVGWIRRPWSSARRPRSLTGRTMLHILREGNTPPTWSNMMNALVGASRSFSKILQELLFDQVGVSAGRLRRFTASRNESGRIGRCSRHGRGRARSREKAEGRSPTWPVGGSGRVGWANGAPTGRGAGRTARSGLAGMRTHESPAPLAGAGLRVGLDQIRSRRAA
jgi:hypothetical protein